VTQILHDKYANEKFTKSAERKQLQMSFQTVAFSVKALSHLTLPSQAKQTLIPHFIGLLGMYCLNDHSLIEELFLVYSYG
jgi:hypothetical protein